jgi:TPR repeat protein
MCFYRPTFSHSLMADVEKGDADAQFELGRIYFEGRADESHTNHYGKDGEDVVASFVPGVPRHHAAAAALLQKAADQGHLEAQKLLEVVKLHTPKGVH